LLSQLIRYKDLEDAGVASSWPQLRHMIENEGFPPGFLLSPNARAWRVDAVEKWLAERPVKPSQHVMNRAEKSVRARRAIGRVGGRPRKRSTLQAPEAIA
jgi:predicted DNA-binding transcriptional regulator AlpA